MTRSIILPGAHGYVLHGHRRRRFPGTSRFASIYFIYMYIPVRDLFNSVSFFPSVNLYIIPTVHTYLLYLPTHPRPLSFITSARFAPIVKTPGPLHARARALAEVIFSSNSIIVSRPTTVSAESPIACENRRRQRHAATTI